MASRANGGAGLHCTSCHVFEDHKVAGRGVDLRATDLDRKVACMNCHTAAPHGNRNLDKHTARVDCTACHIPAFARITSTDMNRDFSVPADINTTNRLYEAHIDRQANVVPEYRFWNGLSRFYNYGDAADPPAGQRVLMAGPEGTIADSGAKIYPFKHHTAVQARDAATKVLIPLKMGILFQTGDIDRAIRQGATEAGIALLGGYDFVPTERFMGIFHEVAPEEAALNCTACHDGGALNSGRMNFALLGYTPLPNRDPSLGSCSTGCHSNKADEWDPAEFFTKLHQKHVTDKRLDCSNCHTFRRAN
jgi:hypothetical protein